MNNYEQLITNIPMPIIMHGGGGNFNLTPCAGVIMIISCIVVFIALICFCFALVCGVFDHEDALDFILKIAIILVALCVVLLGISLLCNLIGW